MTETRKKYDEMVASGKATEAQLERQAKKVNDAQAEYNKFQTELGQIEADLKSLSSTVEKQSDAWTKLSQKVDAAGDNMQASGEKMKGVGQTLTTSISAPLIGFGALVGKAALDFDVAAGMIQAEIGTTGVSAEKLQKTAETLWKQGFGQDMASVATKVAGVGKALGDLSEVDLSNVTKGLDLFEKMGWADQQEALRAIKVLMEQFGMSASQAMDYLTKGFQENLDYSGEFLDTISEYSTYFAELGFSSDEMFGKLKSGAESGAFQLDKVGDSIKEFSLRAKDGSKTSTEAFEGLGLSASEMTKQFNEGGDTAKKAFEKVVKALKETKDETKRNEIAVGLFGVQYEDLGEKAFEAMLSASEGLKDVQGATNKAGKALQDNLGVRAQKVWRNFLADMEPVGETLIDLAEDTLPKVAKTIEKVTDTFTDMSPEAQKTVLAIAGIATAAGPTLIAVGSMSTGVGGLIKVVAPLIPMLGAGAGGLAGVLTALTGPVGLTIAGVGLLTGGIIAVKHATDEAKEVNLEHAESLITQQTELSTLSERYNELADKNRLTNDELLKYMDTQTKLQNETDPSKIENLSSVMKILQERSGLTNDEINEMLELNGQIIKTAPEVDKAYSDRGNAIVKNKDALDEVNNRLRESIRLELENQQIKAEANLNQNIQDYVAALSELNEAEAERNEVKAERDAKEIEILDLKLEKENAIREGNEAKITIAENELMLQEGNLNGLNLELSTLTDVVTEKQNSVNKSQEEIDKTLELYNQMINLELAQAGINTEGAEGVAQLDQAIIKTQGRIQTLMLLSQNQGGLNQQQQEELELLSSQLGKQQESRTAIQGMQGDQAGVNQKITEGTTKAAEMTKELDKDVKKDVDVDDQGKAKKISDEAEKSIVKKVTLSATWTGVTAAMKAVLPFFAKGTRNAPEGLAGIAEAGRELVSIGNGLYLAEKPSLVNLPKGAKVIPNNDTEEILRKWNVPAYGIWYRLC